MSILLIKPQKPDKEGKILCVTPKSAGWRYVGFDVYSLKEDEIIEKETENNEVCLVLLTGIADFKTTKETFENIGKLRKQESTKYS